MTEEIVRQIVMDTVSRAGAESGWVSMMFAAIVFGGLLSLGVIVWQVLKAYFEIQTYIRNELTKLLAESNQIITRCTEAMRDSSEAMHRYATSIEHAPCGPQRRERDGIIQPEPNRITVHQQDP